MIFQKGVSPNILAFSQYLIFTNLKIIEFDNFCGFFEMLNFILPKHHFWTFSFSNPKHLSSIEVWGFNRLNIKGRNCLVICDRGVMDASAFITRDQWMTILERINFEEDEIRDNRYNQGNLLRGIDNMTSYILRRPQNFVKSSPYFWLQYTQSKVRGDFAKFYGLLRIYELYYFRH